ncbi:transcription factor [Pseudogymnoascus australis]
MSATGASHMLDPELSSYSCPDAYLDYQIPDFFIPSYLYGAHRTTTSMTYPSGDPHNATSATTRAPLSDFAKPHDDLSHFFAGSPFSWGWNNKNKSNQDNATTTGLQAPLAILTSGFQPGDARTVVLYGHVTPGDEMASGPGAAVKGRVGSSRRGSRKGKKNVSAASSGGSSEPAASPAARVKKPPKPRRSFQKTTTAEHTASKRETFLKRNREAAYKCRVIKNTQTKEVVERVKALGEDNRVKSVEVERLKREVEGLRGQLWRISMDWAGWGGCWGAG